MSQTTGDDSDTDSVSTASTAFSEWDPEKEYEVEQILAEKDKLGECHYLIKWANYPTVRASWEPEYCIIDPSVIRAWKDQQSSGVMKPFDVAAWESNKQRLEEESKKRKLKRKEKRLRAQKSSTNSKRRSKERTTISERLSRERNTLIDVVKNKGSRQAVDSQRDIVEVGKTQLKGSGDRIDAAKKSNGGSRKAKASTNAMVLSKGFISDDSDDLSLPTRLIVRRPPKIGKAIESNDESSDESSDDDRPAPRRASMDNGQATKKKQKSRNSLSKDIASSDADSLMEEIQEKMIKESKPKQRKPLAIETTRKPMQQEKRRSDVGSYFINTLIKMLVGLNCRPQHSSPAQPTTKMSGSWVSPVLAEIHHFFHLSLIAKVLIIKLTFHDFRHFGIPRIPQCLQGRLLG